jgi:alginate O-acetyltransferase complex protein AlgI
MAIGLGHMLGFRFLENFDYPYVSRSITEFWRRWHISLSTWFRDYLYIPLGGNRAGPVRTMFNLLLVFVLCGLWHGASFSFLVWGLFHGAFLVIERIGLRAWLERRNAAVRHVYVMLAVMVGWVFFRANTLPHALSYLAAMAGLSGADTQLYHLSLYLNPMVVAALAVAVAGSTPIVPRATEWVLAQTSGRSALEICSRSLGLVALGAIMLASCLLMAAGTYNPFIYFRF